MYNKKSHDEMIKNSHERSKEYGIEKERIVSKKILKGKEVSDAIRNNKRLITVAAPFVKILYDFVVGSGFIIILTDKEGCILNLIGDKDIVNAAKELNMVIGAYMDEGSIGTNAMGTAIKEDSPIQVSAKEHFITAYHRWTCSAAPIHDVQGNIIGTLNLTGRSHLVNPHSLGLVVAAVRSIENQMKMESTQKKLQEAYLYMNTIMNSISYGILAIDKDGIINSINDTACKIIKLERKEIINKVIDSINSNLSHFLTEFKEGKNIRDEEVHFKFQGLRERYTMDAYPIHSESGVVGTVILLKDMQNVINLVNKYTGMRARYSFEDFIGEGLEIKRIKEYSKNVADSPSTILIEGESGTGKEVLAQAIHNYSNRKDFGFVAINCGAISKNLIESELFGYDEGAFTGAKKGGHPGKFELANGGTLFLDEIGEMPIDMQVNLLRVLQEGVVTRIGGNKYIPINVRVIAATNKDLRKEVAKGNFRQDLYYRLSVIPIVIPPLRERKEDIPLLIKHFLQIKSKKLNKSIPQITEEQYYKILGYGWKGNVRELENFIEKFIILGGEVDIELMDNNRLNYEKFKEIVSDEDTKEYEECYVKPLEDLEKRAILACYKKCNGNLSKVATTLNIGRNTLYSKIKKYNIDFEG